MNIQPTRLDRGFQKYQTEFEEAALRVLRSGWYVLGSEVKSFEDEFADFIGAKHCIGLASGLDALWIAFRLLGTGKGDEVIVAANAYIACVMGITMSGAAPVFVEPDEYYNIDAAKIETAITPNTKAILAVHLYGQPCNMDVITDIAKRHKLFVVEDCAQSHGAVYQGKQTGLWGDIGCFSFYPTKNLGAFGDGGAVVTDDAEMAEKFRVYRNYGSEKRYYNRVAGTNSRLDELQAALLSVRLKHLDELNRERADICGRYLANIDNPHIILPKVFKDAKTVWHQFVIRVKDLETRQALIKHLEKNGVGSIIHYPVPPHLSGAYAYLGYKKGDFPIAELYADTVLSLPLYNAMTDDETERVISVVNDWEGA